VILPFLFLLSYFIPADFIDSADFPDCTLLRFCNSAISPFCLFIYHLISCVPADFTDSADFPDCTLSRFCSFAILQFRDSAVSPLYVSSDFLCSRRFSRLYDFAILQFSSFAISRFLHFAILRFSNFAISLNWRTYCFSI
jgi:hypothetical protein